MTVADQTNKTTAAGNGTTTDFAFAHPYRDHSDLKVYLRDTTSLVETLKTEGADYSLVSAVANAGTGGFDSATVRFVTAPAAGQTVIISREVAPTQALDPNAGGAMGAANIEGALDRLTLMVQWASERLDRAIKFTRGSANSGIHMPDAPSGSDTQLLGWNAARTDLVNYASTALSAGQAVTSFIQTLLDDTTAAIARTTLGMQQIRVTGITYDPASLADGARTESANISATGAAFGDHVQVFPPYDLQGIICFGYVKAADNVRIVLFNKTGGVLDLASSAAWEIRVHKGGQA